MAMLIRKPRKLSEKATAQFKSRIYENNLKYIDLIKEQMKPLSEKKEKVSC